ncbi:MAG: EamA family transporter RarD [Vicinamibacteria bacterium]
MNERERRIGFAAGGAAYVIWGLFPIYVKALASVQPIEVLAHRVTWAAILLLLLSWWRGLGSSLVAAVRSRRVLGILVATTVAIAINWLIYITAVIRGHVLEASLGYFITPLVSVLLGVGLLRERLSRPVKLAAGLAAAGVAAMAWNAGGVPAISLGLALSWGIYGLLRKTAPVGAVVGLTIETLLLLPVSVAYLFWSRASGTLAFLAGSPWRDALLLGIGALTAGPLLLFVGAARRLPLSTLGFLQYISPTIQFLLAVFLYREAFSAAVALAFAFIWSGLAILAAHSIREVRAAQEPT